MNISASSGSYPIRRLATPGSPNTTDRSTLGSGMDGREGLVDTVLFGGLGTIPVIGAASNFTVAVLASADGQKKASDVALAGMFANVLGIGLVATGSILGNTPTFMLGGGLLLASGFAGAYSANLKC